MSKSRSITPWRVGEDNPLEPLKIFCAKGHVVCDMSHYKHDYDIEGNNAKRIVDCVNALDGIANPEQFVQVAKAYPEFEKNLSASLTDANTRCSEFQSKLSEAETASRFDNVVELYDDFPSYLKALVEQRDEAMRVLALFINDYERWKNSEPNAPEEVYNEAVVLTLNHRD